MDVAVHMGTLGAVMLYFRRDIWNMLFGLGRALRGKRDPGAKLAALLVVATVPAAVGGYFMNIYLPDGLRSSTIVGWTILGYGIVLYVADRLGMTLRRVEHLRFSDAIIIGLAQVLAFIPGTSRSGVTMTAARMLGMERPDAARFSMLLSVPTIIGAGLLKGLELYHSSDAALTSSAFTAAVIAFFAGLLAIAAMMAWLRRSTFTPFVVYRVLLGGAILLVTYGWL